MSRLATGEFLGATWPEGQSSVASHAPQMAGLNSSLSRRYGPAIILQELVAEIRLFQPKLTLACKSQKLIPRPGPTKARTNGLTLCPSSRNSPEPLSHSVPSASLASWRHGVATWGHHSKIAKYGVIPTGGSDIPGNANSSGGRRQDLGLTSKCKT